MSESPPLQDRSPRAPMVRTGFWGFLNLDRWDVLAVIVLTLLSLGLRLISPIDAGNTPTGQAVAGGLGYPWNGTESIPSSGKCGSTVGAAGLPVDAKTGKPVIHDPTVAGTPSMNGYTVVCGFVFDEVYFPSDALKDLHQPAIDYFDPEPPLTKLLMTPSVAVLGFNTWGWRFSSALFGSLLVGVMYLVARRLRKERFFALAAATFLSLDGLAFVEARIGVIDIIAIFWVVLTYYAFLLHWQARTRMQWRATLYFLASVVGLGFAAKLTELAPLAIVAAFIFVRSFEPTILRIGGKLLGVLRKSATWRPRLSPAGKYWRSAAGWAAPLHYLVAAGVVVLIFGLSFSRYMTISHPGVVQYDFCSLPGGPGDTGKADPNVVPPTLSKGIGGFVEQAYHDIWAVNSSALSYHSTECRSHPYQSRWFTWPIDYRPVLMYSGTATVNGDSNSQSTQIANFGNPAVWWLAIPALLFCSWRMTKGPLWWRLGLPGVGLASIFLMIFAFSHSMLYWDHIKATTDKPIAVSVNGKLVVKAEGKPGKPDTVYASAQAFESGTGRTPTPDDEIPPVSPGPWFYLGFGGVALFCGAAVMSAVAARRFVPGFIVVGYVASWMMWVPGNDERILFFYHALGILLFAVLALAYAATWLRYLKIDFEGRRYTFAPLAFALVGTVVAAFIFFYPIWTGTPLPNADSGMRAWYNTE